MRMMLRFGLAALALIGLAACSPGKVEVTSDNGEKVVVHGSGGYTLQVVGDDAAQIYIVTAPDGRVAAAKSEGEASSLLGAAEAQNAVARQTAQMAAAETAAGDSKSDDVNIRVPGFSLQVSDDGSTGGGKVRMQAGGFDLDVNSSDDGTGNERAVVRIGGVDADSASQFIDDTDGLSEEVKAQMREKVGL
jgi:hypothetical protein